MWGWLKRLFAVDDDPCATPGLAGLAATTLRATAEAQAAHKAALDDLRSKATRYDVLTDELVETPARVRMSPATAQDLADQTGLRLTTLDGLTYTPRRPKAAGSTYEDRAVHCDAIGDHDSAAMYRATAAAQPLGVATTRCSACGSRAASYDIKSDQYRCAAHAYFPTDAEEKPLTRREKVEQFCRENDVVSEVTRGDGRVEVGDLTTRDLIGPSIALARATSGLAPATRAATVVTEQERIILAQRDAIESLQAQVEENHVTTAEMDRLRMEKADADRQRDAVQKKYRPMKYPGWRYHVDGKRSLLVKNKAHERHACVPHGDWFESPTDAAAARQAIDAHENAPAARKRLAARKRALKRQPALTAKGE